MTRARIHLDVVGQERVIDVPYREGPATFEDLLRTARALSRAVTGIVLEAATEEGRPPSCRRGCTACCRQLIPVSSIEARALSRLVAAMPPKRRKAVRARFDAIVAQLVAKGILIRQANGRHALASAATDERSRWLDVSQRYFALALDCPFLEQHACSIHEDAPLVCREYYAATPKELCDRLDGGADLLPRPLRTGEALATVAAEFAPIDDTMIPIFLALEWAETEGAALAGEHDGERMCEALLAALDEPA